MSKRKFRKQKSSNADRSSKNIPLDEETFSHRFARALVKPDIRHGSIAFQLLEKYKHDDCVEPPTLSDFTDAYVERGKQAVAGDLAFASQMLAQQAATLDVIFTQMALRMSMTLGKNMPATETYARIALRAQSNSRATLEALAKLHQPREQTVRHVHVNEGGQAVIANQFHHHPAGGNQNEPCVEQPLTTGAGATGASPALSRPNSIGPALPVASHKRGQTLSDARRQG